MQPYNQAFYAKRYERTVYSANTVLSILLQRIPIVRSAVDVGCGVGTWLSVLEERGATDIQGLDGSWVDQDLLAIPRTSFKQIDLSSAAIALPRKYDLAISLEVAEHLPPSRAKDFVEALTAMSDYVLFSAATPFQGGVNHINEQWQSYWVELFDDMNYRVHDFIRPRIWNDSQIPFWYRQNALVFANRDASGIRPDSSGLDTGSMPLDVVHPDLFLSKVHPTVQPINANGQADVRSSFKLLGRSLRGYVGKRLGKGG